MKILFSGGGTLGPVTPLLALWDELQEVSPNSSAVWIGTKHGPEKKIVEHQGLVFVSITSVKLRRYFSWRTFLEIPLFFVACIQALTVLLQTEPDVCISAGGFVSVPVHVAAWFLGIPTWVHQQDSTIGLANRLMAPSATVITTALAEVAAKFSSKKTLWLGNPVRARILQGKRAEAIRYFKLQPSLSTVLAMGGGTGSERINNVIVESLGQLKGSCQIIHLTGITRSQDQIEKASEVYRSMYHPYPFLGDEIALAYAAADVVVARGGFGTLSEVAALKKPIIIIPKEGHQEENARYFEKVKAAVVLSETLARGIDVAAAIKHVLLHPHNSRIMAQELHRALPRAQRHDIVAVLQELSLNVSIAS